MILTDLGIMVVASAPILDSEREGLSAGTLIFGKLLTEPVVELLVQQTGVSFQLIEPNGDGLPKTIEVTDSPVVVESSDTILSGYQVLRDSAGIPIGVIRTQTPRDITKNGTQTLMAALGLLILAGIAVLIAVVLGLRVIALNPLRHLTNTVVDITRTGDLKNRSGMKRDDEIGVLSTQFDEMLAKLETVNDELGDRFEELNSINKELAASEARANYLAHHDSLTGLPNRLAMLKHLDKTIQIRRADQSRCVIIFADLDRFKLVNDTLGHGAGDELIRLVAIRIKKVAGQSAHVSRLGGDEFALICGSADHVEALCEALVDCFGEPFSILGNVVKVSVSLGVAAFDDMSLDATDLMRRADIALYSSKDEGRDQYRIFHDEMDKPVLLKHNLMRDLVSALDDDGLFMHYQPLVTPDGERISGIEALVRWRHPERGDIPPSIFIPMAEDTGLIHKLGEWVLRAAMTDAARWPGMTVAINLSPIQFFHHGFVDRILKISAETEVNPSNIEFEITENVLIGEIDQAVTKLTRLKEAGFQLVLDDFGTGYASLNYLRKFPFDKLKIDRSFTAGLGETAEDMQIIHSIVGLARALELSVTAEGVETPIQHRLLQAAGCSQMQGFCFYRPMLPDEIDQLLSNPQSLIQSA